MTLREALDDATAQLSVVPELRDEAREDATLLLLHSLDIHRTALLTTYDRTLTPAEQAAYEALIARRRLHEPVQYITGEREFYGLPLRVTPDVLIPRNLTEHLVEAVLHEFRHHPGPLRIADVGTGSGAIAIAIAHHLPQAHLTALDTSPAALAVASANAERNRLSSRIRFAHSNLLEAVAHEAPFDAIVSNPPYVSTLEREILAPQVRHYEPAAALYAGPSGFDIYLRLIPQAHAALKSGGLLALEFGPHHDEPIAGMLEDWDHLRFIEDFDRAPRIALARKP